MMAEEFPKWDYKEYPKTLPPDDLWGQVRRTVYGKPVPENQIQMMVDAIIAGLNLGRPDVLLDIGCGNGALTERLFPHCNECLGVDFSEYLISVANARFASPRHLFVCKDVLEYLAQEENPLRFNKTVCFAVLSYLSDANARKVLKLVGERFVNVCSLFLGNIPDAECAASFFGADEISEAELNNPESQIGVWRTRQQMVEMAEEAGWQVRFQNMPHDFYQTTYRYNAILER